MNDDTIIIDDYVTNIEMCVNDVDDSICTDWATLLTFIKHSANNDMFYYNYLYCDN